MTQFVWSDFFDTTLAASVASGDTSISVASAANAPTIAAGQQWAVVVQSASTATSREVMYVTAITSTTFTVTRAQEGTSAGTWAVGDIVFGTTTSGILGSFGQKAADQAWTGTNTFDTSPVVPNATAADQAAAFGQTTGRLINIQTFTNSGTYTPSSGMTFAIVEVQSGGGGAGGTATPNSGQSSVSCAGQAGNYGRGKLTAAAIGSSQPVTVGTGGAGGAGGSTQGGNGSPGGSSSFGTLISQPGGGYGLGGGLYSSSNTVIYSGTTAASATNCFDTATGGVPANGASTVWVSGANILNISSPSGASRLGAAAGGSGGANGQNGPGYGSGGGGTSATPSTGPFTGGSGGGGVVRVWEYA